MTQPRDNLLKKAIRLMLDFLDENIYSLELWFNRDHPRITSILNAFLIPIWITITMPILIGMGIVTIGIILCLPIIGLCTFLSKVIDWAYSLEENNKEELSTIIRIPEINKEDENKHFW